MKKWREATASAMTDRISSSGKNISSSYFATS
jgi:hypothetical protein